MAAERCNVFSLKTFCVITGASKGFGKCMAVKYAPLLPPESVMLLMARSIDGLQKTKRIIGEKAPDIRVRTFPVDLGKIDKTAVVEMLTQTFTEFDIDADSFEQAIIIHNAASLGDVTRNMAEHNDVSELQQFWQLNLTSMLVLNSVFLDYFTEANTKQRLVMNISSICALQPFRSWSLYCTGNLNSYFLNYVGSTDSSGCTAFVDVLLFMSVSICKYRLCNVPVA